MAQVCSGLDGAADLSHATLETPRAGATALEDENRELRAELDRLRSEAGLDPGVPPWSQFVLPAGPAAPASARSLISLCIGPLIGRRMLADAQLLVSELVTNSLVHGDLDAADAIRVRLRLDLETLHIEVRDPGGGGSVASPGGTVDRGSGRGLEIVAVLSEAWGVRNGRETCVWAEMERA